ncbi:MAG: signal transduction histidine kinase [Alteromonadaceae bacterium]|jgi:signal transduction histidine kinase
MEPFTMMSMTKSAMTPTKNISTLRRSFVLMIVGFVAIALIISTLIIAKIYIKHTQQELLANVQQLANLISTVTIVDLTNDDHDNLHNKLKKLNIIPNISYIHIYRVNSQNEIDFFTSYNKGSDYPAIPNKINSINVLSTPKISNEIIEFILPITQNNELYGYVYLQSNNDNITSLKNQIITTLIITSIIIIFLGLMVSLRLSQIITTAINVLVDTIQKISQNKDYTIECPEMPHKEFDILARNLNIMLNRTERHIFKLSETKQQSITLTKELENKVNKRTDALKESNQELLSTLEKLHQFQGKLVESEKMASLGDMVAGVAHEVNTPIGLGVTASTLLADRLNEIKTAFEEKTLKSSHLKKFLNEGQENVDIIYRNLNRAANLISSFKKVAVDQSNENIHLFNVNDLLNEVVLTLAPEINRTPYRIELNCPDDLSVTSKPGPINQIIINLILNSIIHGFEARQYGTVYITVMLLSHQLNIHYRDDGIGIDESIKNKVFEPFTTTKRGSGGSGLGLHLVYNLVTQALGGSIEFQSEKDQGVSFDISFPID